MPISDIRQAGNGLSTMGEIDRNGSSDSGISFNSCLSDENLEYLSAEEKACLMYLEETIQSLDTEDDSALTNDECVQLPARGNVANKAAHLSASIVLKPPSKDVTKGLYSSGSFEQNSEILNYMVPTPFVLANRSSQVQTKPGSESSQKKKEPKVTSKATKIHQEAPPVSPKTIVVKESKDHKKNQQNKALSDNPSARGPLSYEALVHLRTSASIRKSGEETSTNKVLDGDASRYHLQNATRDPKLNPPTVAPKPKIKLPVHQEGASSTLPDSTMPYLGAQCADNLMNPEKVRMEALCKLGLLKKDTKPQANEVKSHVRSESLDLRSEDRFQPPEQTCHAFHQSTSNPSTFSSSTHHDLTLTSKSATLEDTSMGMSGSGTKSFSKLATNNHFKDTQVVLNDSTAKKPFNLSSSHTKVSVPSIGKDRREALRKLGLLKN